MILQSDFLLGSFELFYRADRGKVTREGLEGLEVHNLNVFWRKEEKYKCSTHLFSLSIYEILINLNKSV